MAGKIVNASDVLHNLCVDYNIPPRRWKVKKGLIRLMVIFCYNEVITVIYYLTFLGIMRGN
jgi:hypothetical protein